MLFALLSVSALVGGALAYDALKPRKAKPEISADEAKLWSSEAPSIGPDSAKVKVTVFLDPECPRCADLNRAYRDLPSAFGAELQIKIRYHLGHTNSKLGAQALEAARVQGKFLEMLGLIQTKTDWMHKKAPQDTRLEQLAEELGLDLTQYRTTLNDSKNIMRIQRDNEAASTLGIKWSPVVFVNGKSVEPVSKKNLFDRILLEMKGTKGEPHVPPDQDLQSE